MVAAIGTAFTGVLGWIGEFISALTGADGVLKDMLPVFVIGVAVSVVMLGIKSVKSMTWGA